MGSFLISWLFASQLTQGLAGVVCRSSSWCPWAVWSHRDIWSCQMHLAGTVAHEVLHLLTCLLQQEHPHHERTKWPQQFSGSVWPQGMLSALQGTDVVSSGPSGPTLHRMTCVPVGEILALTPWQLCTCVHEPRSPQFAQQCPSLASRKPPQHVPSSHPL